MAERGQWRSDETRRFSPALQEARTKIYRIRGASREEGTIVVVEPIEKLSDNRYAFVTVWVLLRPSDELIHGEIRDANDRVCGRFKRWDDLLPLLQAALTDS